MKALRTKYLGRRRAIVWSGPVSVEAYSDGTWAIIVNTIPWLFFGVSEHHGPFVQFGTFENEIIWSRRYGWSHRKGGL